MTYQLQRLYDFAAGSIASKNDLAKFIGHVQSTGSGSIVWSDDRIRFSESNAIHRFRSQEDARRVCDLLEDYYATCTSKPTIQCDE